MSLCSRPNKGEVGGSGYGDVDTGSGARVDEAEEDANLEEKSASGRGGGIPSVICAGKGNEARRRVWDGSNIRGGGSIRDRI